jgi:alpha-L-arabinofuranosidase
MQSNSVEQIFDFDNFNAHTTAQVFTLTGQHWNDENTLAEPEKVMPQESEAVVIDNGLTSDLLTRLFKINVLESCYTK